MRLSSHDLEMLRARRTTWRELMERERRAQQEARAWTLVGALLVAVGVIWLLA